MGRFYQIEQTNHCNLQCPGCPNRLALRPKGNMAPKMFRTIVDQLASHRERNARVAPQGIGEPLLSPHFFKNLAVLAKQRFMRVTLSTNGMAMLPEFTRKLQNVVRLRWLRISLNSCEQDIAEYLQGPNYNFDKVVRNVRRLLRSKPRFPIHIQLFDLNGPSSTRRDAVRLFGQSNFRVSRQVYHPFCNLVPRNRYHLDRSHQGCFPGRDCLFVHWDGDIVGCCFDDTKSQVLGHVSQGLFSSAVRSRIRQLRRELQAGDFSHLPLCQRCLNE